MNHPNPAKVRNMYIKNIEEFEEFISFLNTNDTIEFNDYASYLSNLRIKLNETHDKINRLTPVDKKYSTAFKKMKDNLVKLITNPDDIGRKYAQGKLLYGRAWEYEYNKGKLKRDLLTFYSKVFKELKKIGKII